MVIHVTQGFCVSTHINTLLWRHNWCDDVSNHQPHDCFFDRSFRRRSKKTSKPRVTGLSPVTGEFPAQMASNAEKIYIWWRHHVTQISWKPLQVTLFLKSLGVVMASIPWYMSYYRMLGGIIGTVADQTLVQGDCSHRVKGHGFVPRPIQAKFLCAFRCVLLPTLSRNFIVNIIYTCLVKHQMDMESIFMHDIVASFYKIKQLSISIQGGKFVGANTFNDVA